MPANNEHSDQSLKISLLSMSGIYGPLQSSREGSRQQIQRRKCAEVIATRHYAMAWIRKNKSSHRTKDGYQIFKYDKNMANGFVCVMPRRKSLPIIPMKWWQKNYECFNFSMVFLLQIAEKWILLLVYSDDWARIVEEEWRAHCTARTAEYFKRSRHPQRRWPTAAGARQKRCTSPVASCNSSMEEASANYWTTTTTTSKETSSETA